VLREDLTRIAARLNNRPRKTLGFTTPSEELTELLARAWFWPPAVSALMDATRREATCGMPC
jgi:hypothetical protein